MRRLLFRLGLFLVRRMAREGQSTRVRVGARKADRHVLIDVAGVQLAMSAAGARGLADSIRQAAEVCEYGFAATAN